MKINFITSGPDQVLCFPRRIQLLLVRKWKVIISRHIMYEYLKLGKSRFRHYSFTLGLGFLGLHRRPVLDSICP